MVIIVLDNPPAQVKGSEGDELPGPSGPMAKHPNDILPASFQQATLHSERIRIIGLILVFAFILVVIVIRALFGGMADQVRLLPAITLLLLASAAYESLMLGLVGRAIKRTRDLPLWAWSVNAGIEAMIPTIAILRTHGKPVHGALHGPGRSGNTRLLHLHHPLDLAASTKPLLPHRPGLGAWFRRRNLVHAHCLPTRLKSLCPGLSASGVRHVRHLHVDLRYDRGVAFRPVPPARRGRPERGRDPRTVRAACAGDRPA